MAAHRARSRVAPVPPAAMAGPVATAGPASVVYECGSCGQRHLDERRCPECNLFCHSLGPGGECPCCGDPVAISDLIGPAA